MVRIWTAGILLAAFGTIMGIYAGSSKSAPEKVQLLSPVKTLELLQQHQEDAIVVGSGTIPIYAFIDPECSASQDFMQHIYGIIERNPERNRFYLFLYHLDGKDSDEYIATIQGSDTPELLLKTHMVKHIRIETELADSETEDAVERVATMAREIGVYKRPYIISDGKVRGE